LESRSQVFSFLVRIRVRVKVRVRVRVRVRVFRDGAFPQRSKNLKRGPRT
jgi:hypothetical protein